MPPRDPQAVLEKLGQTILKIDSFFLRRTGFIASQTVLKLGEYNLNCVPATIGVQEGRFLAVLTPSEVNLFSRFKEGTHILILTFDNSENHDIARFPLRVALKDIVVVPDRKNVCFLQVRFKSMPGELVLFLGAYLEELEERQHSWESLSASFLTYRPERALSAGLGFGSVLCSASHRLSVEIQRFHTKRIEFRPPEGAPPLAEGGPFQLRLVFQGRTIALDGTYERENAFLPDFNVDWLDFVEEVRFQDQLKARSPSGNA